MIHGGVREVGGLIDGVSVEVETLSDVSVLSPHPSDRSFLSGNVRQPQK